MRLEIKLIFVDLSLANIYIYIYILFYQENNFGNLPQTMDSMN